MCLLHTVILLSATSCFIIILRIIISTLLLADPTSKAPSVASLFTWRPYPLSSGSALDLGFDSCVALPPASMQSSQVLKTSLHACHGLRTPLTRHYLANLGSFAWTSTALQASSVRTLYFRSDNNTSGTRIPYGLHNSLSTLHSGCSIICHRLTCDWKVFAIHNLRTARKTRYGWLAKPFPTGTFTLLDAPSFACRTNAFISCSFGGARVCYSAHAGAK